MTLRYLLPAAAAAVLMAQQAAVVPPELPVASNPDFLLNQKNGDPLCARFPWIPQPLYHGGKDTVGPLDVDWVWPDLALVDWDRDGLPDVVRALSAGTYSHRPKEQQFRALVFRNSGERRNGIPVFHPPYQTDLSFPLGSMVFDDLDGDGVMDLIVLGRNVFRWYKDATKSGERRFEFQGNVQDYGSGVDLKLLETVSMSPSLQLVDWDGDGRKDLLVGGRGGNMSYYPKIEVGFGRGFAPDGSWIGGDRNGSVVFHKNLGARDGKPAFSTGRRLIAGDDERAVTFYDTATAVATDYDDDGRLDLVVANFDALFWFRNLGGPGLPKLAAGQRIPVAGQPRLPFERIQLVEATWGPTDRHNLILVGSSFPWYLRNTGEKGAPRYDRIETLLQYNPAVSAGDFAIPAVGDLNGDGKPDLVIGNEDGFLLYVENTSPGRLPETFRLAEEIEAGGKVFRVESPYGLQGPAEARWGYTNPVLTDWDNDGDLDLVVGCLFSHLLYLENTGTKKAARFAAPRVLQHAGGKKVEVVWRTRPAVHDFNGDGKKDLLAVDPEGMLALYLRAADGLEAGERIRDARGGTIKLDGKGRETGRTTLTLMDWDEDGKLDVIAGNAIENFDGLRWYRNVGSNSRPVLERQANLALNLPWNHYHLVEPVDWDGDGKLDIVAGSEGGWIYFYRRR